MSTMYTYIYVYNAQKIILSRSRKKKLERQSKLILSRGRKKKNKKKACTSNKPNRNMMYII